MDVFLSSNNEERHESAAGCCLRVRGVTNAQGLPEPSLHERVRNVPRSQRTSATRGTAESTPKHCQPSDHGRTPY